MALPALPAAGVPGRDLGTTGLRWMRSGECRWWSCRRVTSGGVLQTQQRSTSTPEIMSLPLATTRPEHHGPVHHFSTSTIMRRI